MLTATLEEKLRQARQRFGKPFAHEEGSTWKPTNVPFLTRWFRQHPNTVVPGYR